MATPELPPEFASAITPLSADQRARARTLFDAAQSGPRIASVARPFRIGSLIVLATVGVLLIWWAWR